MIPFFEDLVIGQKFDLGSHQFTAKEMIAFAKSFDRQSFHMDEEAAKSGPYGGLIASGTQTAATWMRCYVDTLDRMRLEPGPSGARSAEMGPSPGYRNMRWPLPVYANDTIHYSAVLVHKRESASRPRWGLVTSDNAGVNQDGKLVIQFTGTVFWERRP